VPPCSFCEIVAGERDAVWILDEPDVVAFLDARPVFPGHTLVVPRAHIETFDDCPPDLLYEVMEASQRVSHAVQAGLEADGSFVATNNRVSQSVPHLHIHVVPRRRKDGLRGFFWPRTKYPDQEAAEKVGAAIRNALSGPRARESGRGAVADPTRRTGPD
jgi:histidine triad (HIT) family protein